MELLWWAKQTDSVKTPTESLRSSTPPWGEFKNIELGLTTPPWAEFKNIELGLTTPPKGESRSVATRWGSLLSLVVQTHSVST
jgi:hypothetical protein